MTRILILTKRQYTNKDLIDDRFGRLREIPLELSRQGYHIDGLCLSYALKTEGLFRDDGVRWQSFNLSIINLTSALKYVYTAYKIARKADLIWACSDSIYGIMGFLIGWRARVPLIFDLYDNFEYFLFGRLPLIRQLYHWTLRNCTAVTCVSEPLAEWVAAIRTRPGITVIENAARTDIFRPMNRKSCRRFLGLPEQGIFIGTAGAIHPNRGIGTLFEAFVRLKKEIHNLHLVLAGKWDDRVPFQMDNHIHYLGELPLEKIPFVFNSLDAAVICNRENDFGRYCFPQKLYEIMACNVPVVAANTGSMSAFFRDEPHCLFQPENAASLVKSLLFSLHHNPPKRYKPQTWKAMADKMISVVQTVL